MAQGVSNDDASGVEMQRTLRSLESSPCWGKLEDTREMRRRPMVEAMAGRWWSID